MLLPVRRVLVKPQNHLHHQRPRFFHLSDTLFEPPGFWETYGVYIWQYGMPALITAGLYAYIIRVDVKKHQPGYNEKYELDEKDK
jgi:hypothetical protein